MTERPAIVAQKCLSLYRQAHVILGGWPAVNSIFVKEVDDTVLSEIEKLPCGGKLAEHIENLQSGKTPMDSIEPELLPYGGAMNQSNDVSIKLSSAEISELKLALDNFEPDVEHLNQIKNLGVVKKFGEQWSLGIADAVAKDSELSAKWKSVQQTFRAHSLWDYANFIISNPITDRERALVQADLLEYETYLPMFGNPGKELLSKLHNAISTM